MGNSHEIRVNIIPICTACGKELRVGALESKPTGDPLKRDNPYARTEQRLFVYACEHCFKYIGATGESDD